MNKRLFLLGGIVLLLIVIAVVILTRQGAIENSSTDWNATDPQTLMIPRWFLNTLVLDGQEIALGEKLLNLQFEEGGNANGEGGCNSFFATYQVNAEGKLTFGPIGSTKMACETGMDAESAYFAALGKIEQFRTEEGKLTLSSADGKTKLIYNMPPK